MRVITLAALVGSFDGTVMTSPLFAEPVYGSDISLIPLAFAIPPSGGAVAHTVTVPNSKYLFGVEAWFQAFQLTSAPPHASPAVGGIVR